MAQDDAKDMRTPALAIGCDHRRASAEVDLSLVARPTLEPSKRQGLGTLQPVYEPLDTVVTDLGVVVTGQILVDPNRREALLHLPLMISRKGSQSLVRPSDPVGALAGFE